MENRCYYCQCIQNVSKNIISIIKVLEKGGFPFVNSGKYPKMSPAMSQIGNSSLKRLLYLSNIVAQMGPLKNVI